MEGGHRTIERLGHPADRCGAEFPTEHRQQRLADLTGRQAEDKAGEDDPVDLGLPPGMGAQNPGWAVTSGPRHPQFDVAERGQQMARVMPIAPIRSVTGLELVEIAVDRHRHLVLDDLRQGLTAERAIAFAPLQAFGLHRLHHLECHW